jgi:hypothetical protein
MSGSARVISIDTIRDFRAALCRFGEDTKNALGAVDMEIRRVTDWLVHDRPMYWQNEIKRRKEDLAEAQAALFRKRLQAGHDRQVYDSEEKEQVRVSQRRLLEAEEKLEIVKKWAPAFQHAVSEYLARARPTGDMLESDLKLALTLLDRMTGALDAYLAMAPPTSASMEAVPSASSGTTPSESSAPAAPAEPPQAQHPEVSAVSTTASIDRPAPATGTRSTTSEPAN